MGTVTGHNTGLSARLLIEDYRRQGAVLTRAAHKMWVDAGYCIDAPELIAAGSHERDIFGDGPDDWLPMPTPVERLSSNVELSGPTAGLSPEGRARTQGYASAVKTEEDK